MPLGANKGNLKNTQLYNPLNASRKNAQRHVYDDAIRITAPPMKGKGIYKTDKEKDF